jgi:hypothetical protein
MLTSSHIDRIKNMISHKWMFVAGFHNRVGDLRRTAVQWADEHPAAILFRNSKNDTITFKGSVSA